jgi:hypothetical protein
VEVEDQELEQNQDGPGGALHKWSDDGAVVSAMEGSGGEAACFDFVLIERVKGGGEVRGPASCFLASASSIGPAFFDPNHSARVNRLVGGVSGERKFPLPHALMPQAQ